MSTEEQSAAIGRTVMERAQAKRELALVDGEIKERGAKLHEIGSIIAREQPAAWSKVAGLVTDKRPGSIDSLLELLDQRQNLAQRIADLTARLQNAGIE